MRRHLIPILTLALAVVGAFGCKKDTKGSAGKSVDAIISGDETKRQDMRCGTPGSDAETPAGAVSQVFDRLPKRFRSFPELKAHIKTADAETVRSTCKEVFEKQAKQLFDDGAEAARATSRLNNLGACWSLSLEGKLDKVPVPTIHVAGDVTAIHNNLIAMVTYALVELYIDGVGDGFDAKTAEERQKLAADASVDGTVVSEADVLKFVSDVRDLRKRLTVAVLADLKTLGRTDTIESYQTRFGIDGELADSRILQNMIFAETVESYFCSDASKALFTSRGMEKTWAVAQELESKLN